MKGAEMKKMAKKAEKAMHKKHEKHLHEKPKAMKMPNTKDYK
jgi:hypothetical protein